MNKLVSFKVNAKANRSLATKPLRTVGISEAIASSNKAKIEASGSTVSKVVASRFANPFISAAHISFSDHYPLVLTPDAVWLTIAQGFAAHVNANAEDLRSQFVSHKGKQLIMIRRDGFVKGGSDNDWQGCFGEFSDKLEGYIGKKRDLIVSNFSETGPIEKAASEIVLMESMKNYFKFGMMTLCGIPEITLTGTVDDWKNIRTRAKALSEFKCEWWIDQLIPSLDHFVKAAEGNADIQFWDNFYKSDGGSGGPYVNGWINTLFPYIEDYKGNVIVNKNCEAWDKSRHGPSPDNYLNGISKVPFKWQYGDVTFDMEFAGGFVGVSQDDSSLALTPAVGWVVKDLEKVTEGPIDPNEDW